MKNEYIAGDLVKYLSQVVKIVEVYQDGTCYFGNETMCGQQDCKDAEQIPLTTKILEKNGWKKFKRSYSRDYCYRRNGYPTLNICSENEVYFHWGDHNKSITAVHQLQHLLFGLELNSEMEV